MKYLRYKVSQISDEMNYEWMNEWMSSVNVRYDG